MTNNMEIIRIDKGDGKETTITEKEFIENVGHWYSSVIEVLNDIKNGKRIETAFAIYKIKQPK